MNELRAFAVPGLPEVVAGDDLPRLVLDAVRAAGEDLLPGDVLVVSSKVVSKAEGRTVPEDAREAATVGETVRLVARRRTPRGIARVVQAAAGPVMAAAGVDSSNVAAGTALLLPVDPDASARGFRRGLGALGVDGIGVVLSDTAGRPWREGQVDFALGAAGVQVVEDLRGGTDTRGRPMDVTVRVLVDELASLADLVKGKLGGLPVAVVRGLPDLVTTGDRPGAGSLLREAAQDWFRLGHVEAVRAALGIDPEAHEPPSVLPDDVAARLARVVEVALAAPLPWPGEVTATAVLDGAAATLSADTPAELGAVAQRLTAVAWSEDLTLMTTLTARDLRITARSI